MAIDTNFGNQIDDDFKAKLITDLQTLDAEINQAATDLLQKYTDVSAKSDKTSAESDSAIATLNGVLARVTAIEKVLINLGFMEGDIK